MELRDHNHSRGEANKNGRHICIQVLDGTVYNTSHDVVCKFRVDGGGGGGGGVFYFAICSGYKASGATSTVEGEGTAGWGG